MVKIARTSVGTATTTTDLVINGPENVPRLTVYDAGLDTKAIVV